MRLRAGRRPLVRLVAVAAFVAGLFGGGGGALARADATCMSRLLVLSAFPAEIGPLLEAADIDQTVTIDKRHFFVGTLQGKAVVLALTGIGTINADKATRDAFDYFTCDSTPGISGVVFSGVAGGSHIGDVTVPDRWTLDGTAWLPIDTTMRTTAANVADSVTLEQGTPAGDPACACIDPGLVKTVRVDGAPEVKLGGDGITSDPLGGRRLPCAPNGGDVFGCEPCRMRSPAPPDAAGFVTDAAPFIDPTFFLSYFGSPPASDPKYAAQDMETASVAAVAQLHQTPFIAFRGVSDGGGDPLHLPGFPFQFFAYRQLAADNAAAMTLAFLQAWSTN